MRTPSPGTRIRSDQYDYTENGLSNDSTPYAYIRRRRTNLEGPKKEKNHSGAAEKIGVFSSVEGGWGGGGCYNIAGAAVTDRT
jgi:hypothetical protein